MKGNKMKFAKLLSVVLIALLFVSTVSYSQTSLSSGTARMEALGYSRFLKDAATDINNNPAWTGYYRNYGFGDIGRGISTTGFDLENQYVGFTAGVTKGLTLGAILNKEDGAWDSFSGTTSNLGINKPIIPFKGLIGLEMNPNMYLGLAPYYASWSYESNPTSTNSDNTPATYTTTSNMIKNSSRLGVNAGLLFLMKGNDWVEGTVKLGFNGFKYDSTASTNYTASSVSTTNRTSLIENEGGMEFAVDTRGWFTINKSNGLALVPFAGIGMYSWNPKQTGSYKVVNGPGNLDTTFLYTPHKYSYFNLNAGVGLNFPVTNDIQIAGGLSFDMSSSKITFDSTNTVNAGGSTTSYTRSESSKSTDFTFPLVNLSAEWKLTDWLVGRAGYNRSKINTSTTSDVSAKYSAGTYNYTGTYNGTGSVSNPSSTVQTLSLGVGFEFGRFALDGTVSEKWLKEGVYILSGRNNDLFGVVSFSYNFK